MKIGLAGYQGSGKSTLFEWLTGIASDPSKSHEGQSAQAMVNDPRIAQLSEIFKPKKISVASIELTDTPGLSRSHEGSAARLATIREADALALVVDAFSPNADPLADVASFAEDLTLADLEILTGRIERAKSSTKKSLSKVDLEKVNHEIETLEWIATRLEAGDPVREDEMTDSQLSVTKSFRLFSEKPRIVIVNTTDDEENPERFTKEATPERPYLTVGAGIELELAGMEPEERDEFVKEMGIVRTDRDTVLEALLKISGQKLFFTAGEKEVRSWLIRVGGTALEAAAGIHTDLARGFIRAEVMTVADLVRLGSEREVKAAKLVRQEPKDYVVGDDDTLFIKFNV